MASQGESGAASASSAGGSGAPPSAPTHERKESVKLVAKEGGFVCIVDGDGKYNISESELKELIMSVDPEKTRNYSIVGIMGCQSTGAKATRR